MNKVVRERFKLQKAKIKHLKQMHALQVDLIEKAREIADIENKRRLVDLNHEAERIKENQGRSISVEKFEGTLNQQNGRMDQMQKDIQLLSDAAKKAEGRGAWTERYIPWGIVVILSVVTILLSYFQVRNEL